MPELRCSHGFLLSQVSCPLGCGQHLDIPRARSGERDGEPRQLREKLKRDPRVDEVASEVAVEFGVDLVELYLKQKHLSPGTVNPVVRARAEVVKRCQSRFAMSSNEVARALGIDRATLAYGLEREGVGAGARAHGEVTP